MRHYVLFQDYVGESSGEEKLIVVTRSEGELFFSIFLRERSMNDCVEVVHCRYAVKAEEQRK